LAIQPWLVSQTATPACDRIAKSSTEDESPVDTVDHRSTTSSPFEHLLFKKAEMVEELPRWAGYAYWFSQLVIACQLKVVVE
jgi:hypothetical protein